MKRICTVLLFFSSIVAAELFCMKEGKSLERRSRKGREEYQRIYQKVIDGMSKKDTQSGENELDEFITAEVEECKKSNKVVLDAIFAAILEKSKIDIK